MTLSLLSFSLPFCLRQAETGNILVNGRAVTDPARPSPQLPHLALIGVVFAYRGGSNRQNSAHPARRRSEVSNSDPENRTTRSRREGQDFAVRGIDPRCNFCHFSWVFRPVGPSLSMTGHYKNRCGKGKATANGFLTNLLSKDGWLIASKLAKIE
jgi:hypothetical protein